MPPDKSVHVSGCCGYCGADKVPVAFTGRRWLCHQCWAEALMEEFPAAASREQA